MDDLRKLVVALGAMGTDQLRQVRRQLQTTSDHPAKELVINLIDLYISIGDDPPQRARAAAACLVAINRIEGRQGAGASPGGSSGGSLRGKVIGALVGGTVLYLGAAKVWSFWPFSSDGEPEAAAAASASAPPAASAPARPPDAKLPAPPAPSATAVAAAAAATAEAATAAAATAATAAQKGTLVIHAKPSMLLHGSELLTPDGVLARAQELPPDGEVHIRSGTDKESLAQASALTARISRDPKIQARSIKVRTFVDP